MPGCLQSPCASAPDFPERLCCNLSGNSFVWYHIWYQFPAIYHYFCTAPAVLSHNPSCRNSTKIGMTGILLVIGFLVLVVMTLNCLTHRK